MLLSQLPQRQTHLLSKQEIFNLGTLMLLALVTFRL